jgi:hypothetical protein
MARTTTDVFLAENRLNRMLTSAMTASMQRTTYECDRCHKQIDEGDPRRGLELPPCWRQVFKGTTLTYELCEECSKALEAWVAGAGPSC